MLVQPKQIYGGRPNRGAASIVWLLGDLDQSEVPVLRSKSKGGINYLRMIINNNIFRSCPDRDAFCLRGYYAKIAY